VKQLATDGPPETEGGRDEKPRAMPDLSGTTVCERTLDRDTVVSTMTHLIRRLIRRCSALPGLAAPPIARYAPGVKLPVTLERDETGMIVAECPSIPGCVTQATTAEEALAHIREAIIGCLEVRAEQGFPLTVRTVEVDIELG
jgi:predicted RNase H-like HicB family nuclease